MRVDPSDRPLALLAAVAFAGILASSSGRAFGQDRSQFRAPEHLPALSSPGFEAKPDISNDRLTLLFASSQAGGVGDLDLWVATRGDVNSPFGPQSNVAELNSVGRDHTPTTTGDGLEIIYSSNREPGGLGTDDAWMATRPDVGSPWGAPVNLPVLSSANRDMGFSVTPDGLCLYFTSNRPDEGDFDLYVSTRSSRNSPWIDPIPVAGLNTPFDDKFPSVTADNRTLYFASNRPGSVLDDDGNESLDLWVAMRPDENSPWTVVENLFEINTKYSEYLMSIADDESELFFVSDRPGTLGGFDLYRTEAVVGVRRYGEGFAGVAGVPRILAVGGDPVLGNSNFGYEVTNIAADAKGFYWVSRFPNTDPEFPLLVGPSIQLEVFQSRGSNPPPDVPRLIMAPIPNNPSLLGRTGYCQAIVLDPVGEGTSTNGRRQFSMTPGLKRTVQSP